MPFYCMVSGSSGGICEKNKQYSDGKKKSLNTGIITVQNYASHVPPKVSHITFAHEVGHNFGSPVSPSHFMCCILDRLAVNNTPRLNPFMNKSILLSDAPRIMNYTLLPLRP